MSFPIRSFISRAALTVNVATMIFYGCKPSCFTNQAVLEVKVWVLQLTGTANIARVRAEDDTAAFWEELRFSNMLFGDILARGSSSARVKALDIHSIQAVESSL